MLRLGAYKHMFRTGLSYLLRAAFYFVVLYSFSYVISAQTFTNFGNSNSNPISAAPAKQAMSPEEYKNMVKSLGKQNQDELKRAVKQEFSSSQPAPLPATTTPPVTSGAPESTPPPPVKMPETTTPPNVVTSPPPPPPPFETQTPTTTASPGESLPPAPTVPAAGPAAPQNQTYTGFGTPDTSKTNQGSSSSPEQSGWKIQY